MADKDLAEKYLESFSDVFADIYNVLLFRKEILLEEGLEEGPTESIYKVEENNLRNQFRDTVKLYKNGLYKVASFGIENESRIDKNMPIRIMGYDYAVYRVQIDREEERKYPAITIVLNFSDTEWKSPNALFDILDNIPSVKNYIIEVYTNELGTDEILIRIGSENRSEAFAKEIKDLFRSKVRVAPSINFESAEYIAKIQMPPMSRKTIKFIDLR